MALHTGAAEERDGDAAVAVVVLAERVGISPSLGRAWVSSVIAASGGRAPSFRCAR
jgi:hypothetical protein